MDYFIINYWNYKKNLQKIIFFYKMPEVKKNMQKNFLDLWFKFIFYSL